MYPVEDQIYGPILREKRGELSAAMELDASAKMLMLPTWVALPLSDKENDAVSVTDVMKREVGRVQTAWGNNVCLWDPRFLKLDADGETDGRHLAHILTQFTVFGCRVIPVVSLREGFTRLSVMANHSKDSRSGLAVRIEFDELGDLEILENLLSNARVAPQECVLLIDLTDADISEHDEFARFLVEAIDGLRARGNWAKIIAAASSYPFKNPASPHDEATPQRAEWRVWDWGLELSPTLKAMATFGDFGADNARFTFDGGGIPIPHLRYALANNWWVVRGGKRPATIRQVARRIAKSKDFMGRAFSSGDEFVANCASGSTSFEAWQWRAANMNHHFMVVLTTLAARYSLSIPSREARQGEQSDFFDGVGDSPSSPPISAPAPPGA